MDNNRVNINKKGYILVLRPEFYDICDQSCIASALLSLFVFRQEGKLDCWLRTEAGKSGENPPIEKLLSRYRTKDLVSSMMGIGKDDRVLKGIAFLVDKGFISIHKNPNPSLGFDNAKFILVHPDKINDALREKSNAVDSKDGEEVSIGEIKPCINDPDNKNTTSDFSGDVIPENRRPINKNIKNNLKKKHMGEEIPKHGTGPDCSVVREEVVFRDLLKNLDVSEWIDIEKLQSWYQSTVSKRGFISEEQLRLALESLEQQVVNNRWDQSLVIDNAISGGWTKFYPCNLRGDPEYNTHPSPDWIAIHGKRIPPESDKKSPAGSQNKIQNIVSEITQLSMLIKNSNDSSCVEKLSAQLLDRREKLKNIKEGVTS